jgi:hypothetical protein
MIKQCTDPTFLGTAIYATVGGKLFKLSRLVAARDKEGAVEFETLNSQYAARFTDEETRCAFVDTCRTIGRLS